MSSSNVMEVITKGRYDGPEGISEPSSCRSSTSHSVRTESQLSLEYLPPEAPYYGNVRANYQPINDSPPNEVKLDSKSMVNDSDKVNEKVLSTNQLFERIQALSEQIHSELGTMHDVESLESYRPTPVDSRVDTATLGDHRVSSSMTSNDETMSLSDQSTNSTVVAGIQRLDSSSDYNEDSPNDCRELVFLSDSHGEGTSTNSNLTTPTLCDSSKGSSACGNSKRSRLYDETHVDPKLRKALEKMKKLDEKLADLDKKEKEVKKQRKLLEQQMDSSDGGSIKTRSALSMDGDGKMYTPVFATQLNDGASTVGDGYSSTTTSSEHVAISNIEDGLTEDEGEEHKQNTRRQDNISGTNFIKRNIELASDAGALVAMTEAEKNRLEQLLAETEEPDESAGEVLLQLCAPDNDEGFVYEKEDLDRMRTIDSQLQAILPPEEWESISCSSRNGAQSNTTVGYEVDEDMERLTPTHEEGETEESVLDVESDKLDIATHIGPGEEVLHQFKMSRNERERLKDIDERLRVIHEEKERIMQAVLPLPSSDLQTLLDQYSQEKDISLDNTDSIGMDNEADGHVL